MAWWKYTGGRFNTGSCVLSVLKLLKNKFETLIWLLLQSLLATIKYPG